MAERSRYEGLEVEIRKEFVRYTLFQGVAGPLIFLWAIGLGQDKTKNLEVPVNLRVVPWGEGVTSGQMERKRAWRIAWIALGVQASVLLTSGAYLLLSPETRRGFNDAIIRS